MLELSSPFIILALPRSRTAWLSAFLSYGDKKCGHDIGSDASSIPDFINRLARLDGTCETAAVIGWQLLRRYIPNVTIITILRPVAEIERSLARLGVYAIEGELQARRAMLEACGASPGVTEIDYDRLDDPDVCQWIFETCLGIPFDEAWYAGLAKKNIQINVHAQMEKLRRRQPELTAMKNDVAAAIEEGGRQCLAAS